ncbi:uncharacterized protein LOC125178153 [Hyalella azteca]|uniref:Uncharacterized protein LOC125178153 n=1 Tax=Hyalella azteca TaxID=294128 RepID=A0A979FL17_HYAAZ|nr:uncharacterized protein LOC125178153 [Hyalella azteca]
MRTPLSDVYAMVDGNASLYCDFDLEGEELYSLQWFKGSTLLMKYQPSAAALATTAGVLVALVAGVSGLVYACGDSLHMRYQLPLRSDMTLKLDLPLELYSLQWFKGSTLLMKYQPSAAALATTADSTRAPYPSRQNARSSPNSDSLILSSHALNPQALSHPTNFTAIASNGNLSSVPVNQQEIDPDKISKNFSRTETLLHRRSVSSAIKPQGLEMNSIYDDRVEDSTEIRSQYNTVVVRQDSKNINGRAKRNEILQDKTIAGVGGAQAVKFLNQLKLNNMSETEEINVNSIKEGDVIRAAHEERERRPISVEETLHKRHKKKYGELSTTNIESDRRNSADGKIDRSVDLNQRALAKTIDKEKEKGLERKVHFDGEDGGSRKSEQLVSSAMPREEIFYEFDKESEDSKFQMHSPLHAKSLPDYNPEANHMQHERQINSIDEPFHELKKKEKSKRTTRDAVSEDAAAGGGVVRDVVVPPPGSLTRRPDKSIFRSYTNPGSLLSRGGTKDSLRREQARELVLSLVRPEAIGNYSCVVTPDSIIRHSGTASFNLMVVVNEFMTQPTQTRSNNRVLVSRAVSFKAFRQLFTNGHLLLECRVQLLEMEWKTSSELILEDHLLTSHGSATGNATYCRRKRLLIFITASVLGGTKDSLRREQARELVLSLGGTKDSLRREQARELVLSLVRPEAIGNYSCVVTPDSIIRHSGTASFNLMVVGT